jgi:hypothetical protein
LIRWPTRLGRRTPVRVRSVGQFLDAANAAPRKDNVLRNNAVKLLTPMLW